VPKDDADYIVEAIKSSAQKESSTVKRDLNYAATLAADFGGMDLVDPAAVVGNSFLSDGSLENKTTFTVNPSDWIYSGCSGFVFDYRYQPTHPNNYYYSPTSSGAPVVTGSTAVSDFYNYASSKTLYVNQSRWVSGTEYADLPFDDVMAQKMPGSDKCLLIQPTTGSTGVYNSSFSVSKQTNKTPSDTGDLYYLRFDVFPFDGYVDTSKFITYQSGVPYM
jgi:hypothetical protein